MSVTPSAVTGLPLCRWVCQCEWAVLLLTWVHISVPSLRAGGGAVCTAPSSPAQGGERHLQAHVPSALPVPRLGSSHPDGDCGWPWGPVTSGWEEVKSKSGTPWIRTSKGD